MNVQEKEIPAGISLENVIEAIADPVTVISTGFEVVLVNRVAQNSLERMHHCHSQGNVTRSLISL